MRASRRTLARSVAHSATLALLGWLLLGQGQLVREARRAALDDGRTAPPAQALRRAPPSAAVPDRGGRLRGRLAAGEPLRWRYRAPAERGEVHLALHAAGAGAGVALALWPARGPAPAAATRSHDGRATLRHALDGERHWVIELRSERALDFRLTVRISEAD